MDYLYDEIEEHEKQQLEEYLLNHPDLRKELDELQTTRELLQQMPLAEPDRQLMVVEPGKRTFSQWVSDARNLLPRSGFGKFGWAVAAGLILLLIVGSAAKLHLDVSDSGFSVSLGQSPVENEAVSDNQTRELLNQFQQQNSALMEQYAETIRQENQQQLQQVVRYIQQQRVEDLKLIEQNMDQIYQANSYRWMQTNQFLGEVLQNVDYQDQN